MIPIPFVAPLVLALLSASFGAHPHVPKAIVAFGAGGKTTVQYFTVPYNADHLKDLGAGFEWHLGFAAFENEVPLTSGKVAIPPARWKLGVVRGEADGNWELLLEPFELWQAKRNRASPEDIEKVRAGLGEKQLPERVVVPSTTLEGPDTEHLEMEILLRGFQTKQRLSSEAVGGASFALRLHFGELHHAFEFQEQYAGRPMDTAGGQGR